MPEKKVLRYLSSALLVSVDDPEHTTSINQDNWTFREVLSETRHTDSEDEPLYEYRIAIERPVLRQESRQEQADELSQFRREAFDIIEKLEKVFPLVTGLLLLPRHGQIEFINAPENWTANSDDIMAAWHEVKDIKTMIKFFETPHLKLGPYRLLPTILEAYSLYDDLSAPIRTAIYFRYSAARTERPASLFLLAKALELVEALIPGTSRREKMRNLPTWIKEELTHDLDWLFKIANRRIEIRHVVRNKDDATLHTQLTDEEYRDFINDIDLVVRGVVADRLDLEVPIVRTKGKRRRLQPLTL